MHCILKHPWLNELPEKSKEMYKNPLILDWFHVPLIILNLNAAVLLWFMYRNVSGLWLLLSIEQSEERKSEEIDKL